MDLLQLLILRKRKICSDFVGNKEEVALRGRGGGLTTHCVNGSPV